MKKRSVISGIMVLMFAALLSGCAKNTESSSNREEKDEGFIREENSKELVVASGWYISCAVDDGQGVYTPELQEGHGSLITADVDVYPSIYEIHPVLPMKRRGSDLKKGRKTMVLQCLLRMQM